MGVVLVMRMRTSGGNPLTNFLATPLDSVYYSRLALARYVRIAAAKKKKAPAKLEEPSNIVMVCFVVVLSLLKTIYRLLLVRWCTQGNCNGV